MKKINKKRLFGYLAILLLVIQVFSIDKTNPPVDPTKDFYKIHEVPDDVANLLKNSCNDCHSNESKYPWYTNIEPISWWVKRHINGGRQKLNFSEWGNYNVPKQNHKIDECIDFVEKKWMPIGSYKLMHSEARLSEADRERLVAFFDSIRTM